MVRPHDDTEYFPKAWPPTLLKPRAGCGGTGTLPVTSWDRSEFGTVCYRATPSRIRNLLNWRELQSSHCSPNCIYEQYGLGKCQMMVFLVSSPTSLLLQVHTAHSSLALYLYLTWACRPMEPDDRIRIPCTRGSSSRGPSHQLLARSYPSRLSQVLAGTCQAFMPLDADIPGTRQP